MIRENNEEIFGNFKLKLDIFSVLPPTHDNFIDRNLMNFDYLTQKYIKKNLKFIRRCWTHVELFENV
jgi:hypothetical protein